MKRIDILTYGEQPCKFRLRSGKEVFGVIWETMKQDTVVHYFASAVERMRYKKAEANNDVEACKNLITEVNIDEIVSAEPLS
ncbi:MAG: hypothetical protein HYU69_15420 [Bacteroidetes bacterium]|nr:hypothetical protein [Bacteroidota bacterium]